MSPSSRQHRTRTHRVVHSVAWPGELVLDPERVRFTPEDADAPAGAGLDVPVGDIADVRHNAREGLLVLELPADARARFVGQTLEPVYAAISAALADRAAAARAEQGGADAEEHAVSLRSGPIIHRGGLHLDADALTFTPRSMLDTLVGVRQQRVEWGAIRRLTALGGPNGLVEILHDGGRLVLQPAAPDAVFAALLARVHRTQAEAQAAGEARAAAEALVAAWPGAAPPGEDATVTLALHGTADHSYRVGVTLVDQDELRFLPEPHVGPPLTLALQTLVRRSGRSRGLPMVRVAAGDTQHAFLLATGRVGAQRFWDALRAPSRVVPWPELGPRTRTRLAEEARFVRLAFGDEEPVSVAPLAVHAGASAWTVVTPGLLEPQAAPGARVRVEIGQDEGVYAFDATLAHLQQRQASADAPAETTVELSDPGDVRVFNQRQGYRVGVRLAASARSRDPDSGLPPGERIAMSVHDLSIGGCRAISEAALPVGALLDLAIELPGRTVRARARVLRAEPTDSLAALPYGLRFEHIAAADEDRVHRFVLQQQRGDLRVPPTDEPSLPEHAFR